MMIDLFNDQWYLHTYCAIENHYCTAKLRRTVLLYVDLWSTSVCRYVCLWDIDIENLTVSHSHHTECR